MLVNFVDEGLDDALPEELLVDPILSHVSVDLFQLMEFDNARCQASKSPRWWMPRLLSVAQEAVRSAPISLDKMLSYQSEPLLVPLLKNSTEIHDHALLMFEMILKFMGRPSLTLNQSLKVAHQLLELGLTNERARDELYMQLFKQQRNNMDDESRMKGWKLLQIVSATMPPRSEFVSLLVHFAQHTSRNDEEKRVIRQLAAETLTGIKRCVRSGPRKTIPTMEEIDVKISDRKTMKTIVYFLDGSIETMPFEIGTTVADAVLRIGSIIGLLNTKTFSLYESQEVNHSAKEWRHRLLHDHSYIADVLCTKFSENRRRLLFKKVLFAESDASILESSFVNLSFLQAQHDYLKGKYPVEQDEAAKLCALQMRSEFGTIDFDQKNLLTKIIEEYTAVGVVQTGSKDEWIERVVAAYKDLQCQSTFDARFWFLQILRSLPYGMAIFFTVDRLKDPVGTLPPSLSLAVNKHGVHFLRQVPMKYLSSIPFRDIERFGLTEETVFFLVNVGGKTLEFVFQSNQGIELCMALKTHTSDVKRRSRSQREDIDLSPSNFGRNYDTHLSRLQAEIDNAENRYRQMVDDEVSAIQELEAGRAQVNDLRQAAMSMSEERSEVESELSLLSIEVLKLSSELSGWMGSSNEDSAKCMLDRLMRQEAELRADLQSASAQMFHSTQEFDAIADVSRTELQSLEQAIDTIVSKHRASRSEKDACIASLIEQIGNITAMTEADSQRIEYYRQGRLELAELRKLQSEVEQREQAFVQTIEYQRQCIEASEQQYKKEQLSRKKIFNRVQDIRGNIRVYARVRPLLDLERNRSQKFALSFPDDVTIAHPWKREDVPREYAFDGVFQPDATQIDVFKETQDLIQSAIDGYNVCIFAYGQTGSGKTFTIYGDSENPGLTPLGIRKLFELIRSNSEKYSFSISCYMLELYRDGLTDLLSQAKPKMNLRRRYSEAPVMYESRQSTSRLRGLSPPPDDRHRLSDCSKFKEKLEIKRDLGGDSMVYVQGATVVQVHSAEELLSKFEWGQRRRHVAATQMNIQSSRSHLIMSIIIEATDLQTQARSKGKLSFVDLAGSERVKKSGSTGEQLKEAQAINKSLSALGDVVSSLSRGDGHIPYRNHKLTMLMSDSIGGNSKTLMFVNVSPADGNIDETQNSLQYAARVRTIKNKATNACADSLTTLKKNLSDWKAQACTPHNDHVKRLLDEFV